ncbi:hypothetical protein [Nonomuraea dietziae]|uniref:hypothetical protein n=1 Tax=Nonomuraea dietziae TaxID=65515 RepID=UPI0033F96315
MRPRRARRRPAGDDGQQGEGSARLLVGTDAPAILGLREWRLAPGEHHDGDAHLPGAREMLWVLSGELTLSVYGQSRRRDRRRRRLLRRSPTPLRQPRGR